MERRRYGLRYFLGELFLLRVGFAGPELHDHMRQAMLLRR